MSGMFVIGLVLGILGAVVLGAVVAFDEDPTGVGAMLEAVRAESIEIPDQLEEEFQKLEEEVALREERAAGIVRVREPARWITSDVRIGNHTQMRVAARVVNHVRVGDSA